MGVTSVVAGNCGGSALDVATRLRTSASARRRDQLRDARSATTPCAGRSWARRIVMPTRRRAGEDEIAVWRAMADGAVGFSTGLQYVPGTYAKTPRSSISPASRQTPAAFTRRTCAMKGPSSKRRSRKRFASARRPLSPRSDLAFEGRQPEPLGRQREGAGADRCRARPRGRRGG